MREPLVGEHRVLVSRRGVAFTAVCTQLKTRRGHTFVYFNNCAPIVYTDIPGGRLHVRSSDGGPLSGVRRLDQWLQGKAV